MRLHTSENLTGGNRSRSPVPAYPLEIPRQSAPTSPSLPPPSYHVGKRKAQKASVRGRHSSLMRMQCIVGDDPSEGNDRPRGDLIIGSLRNWYTCAWIINHGFDSRPRFQRIKEESTAGDKFDGYITYQCPFSFFSSLFLYPFVLATFPRISPGYFPFSNHYKGWRCWSFMADRIIFHLHPAAFILISGVNEANSPVNLSVWYTYANALCTRNDVFSDENTVREMNCRYRNSYYLCE